MILLLGGTSDARWCREALDRRGVPYLLSTATRYNPGTETTAGQAAGAVRLQGALDRRAMQRLVRRQGVRLVIDATHPFAARVSATAMEACARTGCAYLRYQRMPAPLPDTPLILRASSAGQAADVLAGLRGNILLTTGSRSLAVFAARVHPDRLFARVLPRAESIRECERCGLLPSHIVAMQGPFDRELNGYLIRKFDISCMASKQSGTEGGLREKIEACLDSGTKLLVIDPPVLEYPDVVHSPGELLDRLNGLFKE
ncbi:MAG: precorrin-6A reductase [Spirochaetota bacterium]